jgi:hypothetical protein
MSSQLPKIVSKDDPAAAFFKEVDEALKQEHLLNLWHKYKLWLLAAIALLLLGVAGGEGYKAWKEHQARTMAAEWYAFTQLDETAQKAKLPELLTHLKGGYRAMAAFKQADMAATPAEKAKSYALVVKDSGLPQWLRDIARLNTAIVLLGTNDAEAKAQLEVLAQANPDKTPSPAYSPALELLALQAQRLGDDTTARAYTQKLLEQQGLPDDMRARALQRMGALSTLK